MTCDLDLLVRRRIDCLRLLMIVMAKSSGMSIEESIAQSVHENCAQLHALALHRCWQFDTNSHQGSSIELKAGDSTDPGPSPEFAGRACTTNRRGAAPMK